MQTFTLGLNLNCSAVIAQRFLDEARKEAQAPDAPLFLKTMQEKFPEDDDQFMLAIVKNAFRTTLRRSLLDFMSRSGVGGSVSPVQIVAESITQPKDAVAAFAEATDPDTAKASGYTGTAQQLRIGHESPGVLVQGLVEGRRECLDDLNDGYDDPQTASDKERTE